MVSGVNGNKNSLSVLLQQKQKKLDSINQQKQAVQNALNMENDKVAKAQVDLGDKKISLSDAIVELQNHPFKGMKAPNAGDVKYEIKDDEGKSLGIDQKQFDKDMAEFKKAEAEYKALESKVDKTTKEVELGDTAVKELTAIAQGKEEELKATDADYEVTMGDIDALNKQIEEAAKTETLDVTLSKDKNNDTLVEATVNQLKGLQQKGLVDKGIDLENLKPEQLKKLSEAVVNADIKNGTVAEGTALDGTSKDYTGMKAGDSRKYTVAQMQEIAKVLGTDASHDEASFEILNTKLSDLDVPSQILNPLVDLDKQIDTTSTPAKAEDKADKKAGKDKSEIVLPQGVEYRVGSNLGKKADSLADYGIVEKDGKYYRAKKDENGNLVPKDNKAFTADEVNKYFRTLEKTGTKETETKEVEVQKAKSAPKLNQPAVQYEVEDEEELTVDLKALADSHKANQAEAKAVKAEIELEKAEADLKTSKDADEYAVKKENYETKKDKLADARKTLSELMSSSSKSTAFDDLLNGKGFEEFNAKTYAKLTANFKDGAKGTYDINGTRFTATQKISESGTKAYLVNGEYYALRSDGMPDLSKKLNKAEFEK